jgi:hypothetical protein
MQLVGIGPLKLQSVVKEGKGDGKELWGRERVTINTSRSSLS